jgi:hypothetical protein
VRRAGSEATEEPRRDRQWKKLKSLIAYIEMSEKCLHVNPRGYKSFDSDWKYRDVQYAIDETYTWSGELHINNGYNYYDKAVWCHNDSYHNDNSRHAEVEILGDIMSQGCKRSTNKIRIIREIPLDEWNTYINNRKIYER